MWQVGNTKLQIKDSAWQKYLKQNKAPLDTPNPGPKVLKEFPIQTPFHDRVLLEYPLWWFDQNDVTYFCEICNKADTYTFKHCPKCGACPEHQEVRNHSLMWHDGDIHCIRCDAFVREFDAG